MLQDGRLFVRAAQTLEATCAGTDGGTAAGGGETRIESDLIGTLYPSCRKIFARSTFRSVHASTIRISTLNRRDQRGLGRFESSYPGTRTRQGEQEQNIACSSKTPSKDRDKEGVWGVGRWLSQPERTSVLCFVAADTEGVAPPRVL